jgi:hypothetical protein
MKLWSFTLREEHILRVFENRVMRRIFWNQEGGWRRPYDEWLHNLQALPNIVRMIKLRR